MSYQSVSDETVGVIEERINQLHLDGLAWRALSNSKLKKSKDNMCAKVVINGPEARAAYGQDVLFVINEDVFEQLKEEHQLILIDKLLAKIEWDQDKDKIKKSTPDVQEHSGILLKYGYSVISTLSSEVNRIYTKIKEDSQNNNGKDAT